MGHAVGGHGRRIASHEVSRQSMGVTGESIVVVPNHAAREDRRVGPLDIWQLDAR